MAWAQNRQFLIFGSIALVLAAIIAVTIIAAVYETPSCTDGKQNQEEGGIDCGGPCTYFCSADVFAPSVLFVRALSPAVGRTDVLAYLENKNPRAVARDVRVIFELFGSANQSVLTKEMSITLPSATVVPVYLPSVYLGEEPITRAFLSVDEKTLHFESYNDIRVKPKVKDQHVTLGPAPRVVATIENPSSRSLANVKVIVVIFNGEKNAFAASQTIIPLIPAQGEAQALFTWNAPFTETPSRVEVLPLLPL